MTFFITQFLVAYFNVLVRGLQTANVVHGQYKQAALMSLLMSVGQVATIGLVASNPWDSIVPVSLGGMLGVLSSMWLKRKHHRRVNHVKESTNS